MVFTSRYIEDPRLAGFHASRFTPRRLSNVSYRYFRPLRNRPRTQHRFLPRHRCPSHRLECRWNWRWGLHSLNRCTERPCRQIRRCGDYPRRAHTGTNSSGFLLRPWNPKGRGSDLRATYPKYGWSGYPLRSPLPQRRSIKFRYRKRGALEWLNRSL